MRVQLSYHDKNGDEKWHYLEFDEQAGVLYLITEWCSREGETWDSRIPLHESERNSGYFKAVAWIKENLMKSQAPV